MLKAEEILNIASKHVGDGKHDLDSALSPILSKNLEKTEERFKAAGVIYQLLKKATSEVRKILAERLIIEDKGIPTQLLLALAYDDEIAVAKPVLEKVSQFNDDDWNFVIQESMPSHWKVIAERSDLSEVVIQSLVQTEDEGTCVFLMNNKKIVFSQTVLQQLRQLAFSRDVFNGLLLQRVEVDENLAMEIYWSASQELRRQIMKTYTGGWKVIDDALEKIVQELVHSVSGRLELNNDLLKLAERYAERREIADDFLIKVLKRGQLSFFVALLARKAGLSIEFMMDVVKDKNSEKFELVCKSFEVDPKHYATFFDLTMPLRNIERNKSQAAFSTSMDRYNKLLHTVSAQLVEAFRKDHPIE